MNRIFSTALALAVGLLPGCSREDRPAVQPVCGRLVVGGLPAAHARLALHPADRRAGPFPVAVTGPDGTFRLMTYSVDDGAPAGEYVVTLSWPNDSIPIDECGDPNAHDRLAGYYLDPARSPLRVTIRPGPNNIAVDVPVGSGSWSLPRKRELNNPKKER